MNDEQNMLLNETCHIIAGFVSNNPVPQADLPNLIRSVYSTLQEVQTPGDVVSGGHRPAVPIKKSITPDFIICLEDGKKLKMLRRYLRSQFGMSPEQYKMKWGLPPDYPLVAPNYAAKRSDFAKKIGLGKTSAGAAARRKR